MKTKEQWDNSGQTLEEFLVVGDEVDDAMADYFTGVLFPACMSNRVIQIGEPYTHNSKGQPMFETLCKGENSPNWIYAGIMVTPHGEECLYHM